MEDGISNEIIRNKFREEKGVEIQTNLGIAYSELGEDRPRAPFDESLERNCPMTRY